MLVDTKDSCDVAIEHNVSGNTDSTLSMLTGIHAKLLLNV